MRSASTLVLGFLIGVVSFFIAHLMDTFFLDPQGAVLLRYAPSYLLAGMVFAIGGLPIFRVLVTQQTNGMGIARRSLVACTASFTIFLVLIFLIDLAISPRWLLCFWAVSMVVDWGVWRWFVHYPFRAISPSSFAGHSSAYFDALPHAPFVLSGLFLLVLTPIFLFFDKGTLAERLANWAFGFLVLAVTGALTQMISMPEKVANRLQRIPVLGVFLTVLFLAGVAYFPMLTGHTGPEQSFSVVVNPNYVAPFATESDVLVSDSPKLRLGSFSDIAPHLDILPDDRGTALWDDLSRFFQDKKQVFWIGVPNDSHDTRGILASFLKANGCLNSVTDSLLSVRSYELRSPVVRPQVLPPALADIMPDAFAPVLVAFEPIKIEGMRFEPRVCNHDAIAIALHWRLVQTGGEPLQVTLSLLDTKGRRIQTQDFQIEDAAHHPTSEWQANASISGYYHLVVPFGTPPGDYSLALGVYPNNGSRLHMVSVTGIDKISPDYVALGHVQLYRGDDIQADPYQTRQELTLQSTQIDLREGLRLVGFGVHGQTVTPGETLNLLAQWRALSNSLPSYTIRVRLLQGDQVILESAGAPVDNHYPTDKWRINEMILDRWDVRIPPETKGGIARLEVGIDGGKSLYLADISVATITHTMQIPTIQYPAKAGFSGIGDLIGYDLNRVQLSSQDREELTLYWRGNGATDKSYMFFAQILASDGRLIAQSNGIPVSGSRPTWGWLNGEIITDRLELEFSEPYQGEAKLIIGMYDATTLERVHLLNSQGDYYELDTRLRVTAP